eukprot:3649750-Prymnesium_polylepis.1
MFLPQFAFKKALEGRFTADAYVVDFQDAVPLSLKPAARQGLRDAIAPDGLLGGKPVIIRINEQNLREELDRDLDAILGSPGKDPPLNVVAVMPSMIERAEQLDRLAEEFSHRERKVGLPEGYYRFAPLIETPSAVLDVLSIAHAGMGRNVALILGHGDLFRLTGAGNNASLTMDFPRNSVLMASRSANLAPIDTPYTHIKNLLGLEYDVNNAKMHGFNGKLCLHPTQTDFVNAVLSPSSAELRWAQRVEETRASGSLATLQRKSGGQEMQSGESATDRATDAIAILDGHIVGPPHIKAAMRILSRITSKAPKEAGATITGRIVSSNITNTSPDRPMASVGDVLPNPYELTITEGMRDLWLSCFYSPTFFTIPFRTA